jgi:hypothetical protein
MRTVRRSLSGLPVLTGAAIVAAVGLAVGASAVGSGVAAATLADTRPGFTAPLGSGKGSVTGQSPAGSSAPSLLGEEPIYYP